MSIPLEDLLALYPEPAHSEIRALAVEARLAGVHYDWIEYVLLWSVYSNKGVSNRDAWWAKQQLNLFLSKEEENSELYHRVRKPLSRIRVETYERYVREYERERSRTP